MKKISLIIIGLTLLMGVKSQTRTPDDLDIIQSVFGKSKKEMTEVYMNLQGQAATAFWPVYNEYEAKRRELVRNRLATLIQYTNSYATLNDEIAATLSKQEFKNIKDMDKLRETYFNKMKKVVGALNAYKFMQMETYLQNIVDEEVLEDIPLVGEFDRLKQ